MNIFGKWGDLPFSRKSDRKKDKSVISFTHEQTIICRQLFLGHMEGFRPVKRKNNLQRMMKKIIGPSKHLKVQWNPIFSNSVFRNSR